MKKAKQRRHEEPTKASLREIPEITRTETLMAFRAYSRHDLGAMFSIGNDEHAER